ncbi:MAG: DUF1648 domain-containing protein [Lacticaseibacillus songhuajiangensis]|jgi:uncharacterized membrane protein|nr:DUF1648 domain-containing protein [Lacticaseibacillus songhuajiangensis]
MSQNNDRKRWQTLLMTLPAILLPMVYGVAMYSKLPARMATHWGVGNQPNGYMSRPIAVFGLPLLMVVLQLVILYTPRGKQAAPRFERLANWIIPVITIVMYITTIQYNLGTKLNIWRIAVLLMGIMFILMGNYLPTVPQGYSYGWHPYTKLFKGRDWRKYTRILAYVMVGGGIALLLSLFFSGATSVVVLAVIVAVMIIWPLVAYLRRA